MKKLLTITACSIPLAFGSVAYAQAPATTDTAPTQAQTAPAAGTNTAPMARAADDRQSVAGLSVKDRIMGKNVYNEKDEKVGDIRDVILDSDGKAAYYVIGAGGFLGMGEHDVAIPFDRLQAGDDRFMLSGYTKDQLKALPQVEVRK